MAEKKYYWLKLPKDFFDMKEVRYLRLKEYGEIYVIIYLKLLLMSLETNGQIKFEHYSDTPEEEIAFAIDEEVKPVKAVLDFLISKNHITVSNDVYRIEKLAEMVGKEGRTASIMRNARAKENQNASSKTSNIQDVTGICHNVTDKNNNVTDCVTLLHREEKEKSREDKEIDKEKEKEKDKDKDKEKDKDKDKDKEIDKDTDIDTRVDTEVREEATLETIRLKNQQLFNDFVADKTLSKKQSDYILGMVNKYDKLITKKQIQGFYNNAMTYIND